MADRKKDSGPYSLYGRRTEHEAEVRVGSHDDPDKAKAEADDMVDTGIWHQATVRDRNDQTVHVGRQAADEGQGDGADDLPPAA